MEQLGIDFKILIAQIINFGILVVILRALMYKPLVSMLSKRKTDIEKGTQLSEELEKQKADFEKEKEKLRSDIQEEGEKIIQRAVEEAKVRENEILQEITAKTQEERSKLHADIEREKEAIFDEARTQALEYAVLISEKMLGEKLSRKEQQKLIDDAVKNISRSV